MLKVAITSPSLDENEGVSGIGKHTRLLISACKNIEFRHVTVGRKDSQKRNLFWIFNQFLVIGKFAFKVVIVDIVHLNIPLANYSLYINFVLAFLTKLLGKTLVIHFRGGELSLKDKHSFLQKLIIGYFLKVADKVISLGEKERQYYVGYNKKKYVSKVVCLPNAVKITEIDGEKIKTKFEFDTLHLVYVGRIDFAKGLKEIISALQSLNDIPYFLHIIGDGPDMSEFKGKLEDSIGKRYKLHGVKSIDEIYAILEFCQIFIMPSHYEGLPNAMLEAMANYVVPIVTPVGSIPEVVSRENGYLVAVKNPKMLAETIRLAHNDKHLLYLKSVAARQLMVEQYSIESYIEKLNEIYHILLPDIRI
ncbi:glycosyltransferase family 4 protein [Pseudomonadales bacterium]|nr:glycosyltransferase family 4 protein [Pseudomonadales bacterium]